MVVSCDGDNLTVMLVVQLRCSVSPQRSLRYSVLSFMQGRVDEATVHNTRMPRFHPVHCCLVLHGVIILSTVASHGEC